MLGTLVEVKNDKKDHPFLWNPYTGETLSICTINSDNGHDKHTVAAHALLGIYVPVQVSSISPYYQWL